MTDKEKCLALERAAPKLSEGELQEINALYPSYIFRRRKAKEVWTSCCGSHGVLPASSEVMDALHTPEPRGSGICCGHGIWGMPPPKNTPEPKPVACPFCGKVSPVKELGRTGRRENLAAYRRAVVFRWHRGALWAVAYDTVKRYGCEDLLTSKPGYDVKAIYRFTPEKAVGASKYTWRNEWDSYHEVKGTALKPGFRFSKPFHYNAEEGMGYAVIGMDEVDKSPFRYCGIGAFQKKSSSLMRYLALCTVYPRQVEMLTKAGLVDMVVDFVDRKKSNATVFDWNEQDPLKSFGLSKPEMKEFLSIKHEPLTILRSYKQLRRNQIPCGLRELNDFHDAITGTGHFKQTVKLMVRYRLTPKKLRAYLDRERARDECKENWVFSTGAGWWCDYIDAAEMLGYDLTNPVFLLPRDLKEHHDRATKAATAVREAQRESKNREKERERCRKLAARYTYTDGNYLIRPPVGAAEIVAEGKALKHCVGGYADRHINGRTTILFLRDRARPGRPLVTIEMNGNNIVQIHGWDDERTACKDNPNRENPRKLYKAFLEPWLAWLKAGSKRDKTGRPVLKNKKKAAGAA